jgi:tRNA G10  N-methylase Trm11
MVEYSAANLAWLGKALNAPVTITSLEQADARSYQWQPFDHIVCETYLGKPLSSLPPKNILQPIMDECNKLIIDFLENAAKQTPSGTRCVIGIPAWVTKNGLLHLPVIDQLSKIGYNHTSFMHANSDDLVYHRENQVVARELLVLTRN